MLAPSKARRVVLTAAVLPLLLLAPPVQANHLDATDVQPANLVVGATSTATVSFTTSTSIPATGRIVVTFPAGFDVSLAHSGSCPTMAGTVATAVLGQEVTLTRAGVLSEPPAAESCTIAGIRNPLVSGSTGTYSIRTVSSLGVTLDQDGAVAADTISAGALSSTNVQPASLVAGATPTVTVSFTTANPIPATGKIAITFPAGFDVSGANAGDCVLMTGGFTTSIAGQVVTLARDGIGITEAAGAKSCTIAGIRNPQVSGSTGTYAVRTTDAADATIDQGTAAADTITPGALAATNVQPADLAAGATSTATATFTTVNPIPLDGRIAITFPAGFDVSGANAATCSTMDGTFATAVAGQIVTITRTGTTVEAAGAQTCTVAGIVNPATSGATGVYALRTADASGAIIDEDAAVAGDTITPATMGAVNVEPASLVAGASPSVTITFTPTNPIPASGRVTVTFPSGFDVSGANAGDCSTMDGGFTTSITGQVVTIARDNLGTDEPAVAQTCTLAGIRNPQVSGSTGLYTVRTTSSGDVAIDEKSDVVADTITPGDISAVQITPGSLVAGAMGTVTFEFTTANPIPADGRIQFVFPAGFNVAGATTPLCTSMDGTVSAAVSGQTVTLTRAGAATVEAAGAQTCSVAGIVNPLVAGAVGDFEIGILDSVGNQIDEEENVAGSGIDPDPLAATDVQPASLVASATGTVTVSFTTSLDIPADGKVKVTFPAGFDATGATGAMCGTMDGTFTTAVAGQVVTITRQADGGIEVPGAQTCTVGGIQNPAATGLTGTYTLRVTNGADGVQEEDAAVAADTIVAAGGGGGGGGGGGATNRVAIAGTGTGLVSSDPLAAAVAEHAFTLNADRYVYGFNIIRITYPDGFTVVDGSLDCRVTSHPGVEVRSVTVPSAGVVLCDVGYIARLTSGSTLAFNLTGILNPALPLEEQAEVALLTRSGTIRGLAHVDLQVAAVPVVADMSAPLPDHPPVVDGQSQDGADGPAPAAQEGDGETGPEEIPEPQGIPGLLFPLPVLAFLALAFWRRRA